MGDEAQVETIKVGQTIRKEEERKEGRKKNTSHERKPISKD